MNTNEEYYANLIRLRVMAGIFTQSDIEQMIDDIAEDDCDVAELKSLIGPALRAKLRAERSWPEVTDCDRLDRVFMQLDAKGICALAHTGNTMSDGHEDLAQVLVLAPEEHYKGFCFYHGQDVECAIDNQGLMIAFGDLGGAPHDDPQAALQVGQTVADALRSAGLIVEWNGSAQTRILIPAFDWKRRANAEDVPTVSALLDRWASWHA
jgi:hypothetical protein